MGIENREVYGCDCAQCWDPGQTPKCLCVIFQGIMKGSAVLPPRPAPPNGRYWITQKNFPDCCIWEDWFAGIQVSLAYLLGASDIFIALPGLLFAFIGVGGACDFWFANTLVDPTGTYYGGYAQVMQCEPGSSAPSLTDLSELVGVNYSGEVRAEFGPAADGDLWAMYAEVVNGTRIHIKKTPT